MHIKFKENRVRKGLQTTVQISGQKRKKKKKKNLTRWIKREPALVYHGTPMLAAFLKGQLALVYLDTLVLAPKFFIPSINTPQCIFGKMMQKL